MLEKIPQSDRDKEVKDFNLSHDVLPVKRALRVHWNVERDEFVFKIQVRDKPLTRCGLSIYDPLALRVISKGCFFVGAISTANFLPTKICIEKKFTGLTKNVC